MQYIRNSMQMIGEPVPVCVAFLVEVTLPVLTVNLEKLKKARFKFNGYCVITIKGFNESGADETLLSQDLSNCLVMEDIPNKLRSILGETPQEGKCRKILPLLQNKGKVNLFQMGEIQKHTPKRNHRRLLTENFGIG